METLIHPVSYSDAIFVFENAGEKWHMARCTGTALDAVCTRISDQLTQQTPLFQVPLRRKNLELSSIGAGFDLRHMELELQPSAFQCFPPTGYSIRAICFPIFALAVDNWLKVIQKEKGGCKSLKIYLLSGAHQTLTSGDETFSTRAAACLLISWARHRLSASYNLPRLSTHSQSAPSSPAWAVDAGREVASNPDLADLPPTSYAAFTPAADTTVQTWSPHSTYREIRVRSSKVSIELVHSGGGVFRYDENVKFVNEELLPKVDLDRQSCQLTYGADWELSYSVTLTLAEGAPARVSAIFQGLQFARPNYIHIFRPKSFLNEPLLREDGVQFLSFAQASTVPPIEIGRHRFTGEANLDSGIRLVVEEMRQHRQSFQRSLQQPNEMVGFWLRKTRKPVLAVLMVQKGTSPPTFFRGVNLEVSMPTGSLCAERNCIGTALAYDPLLDRSDLKLIAVLSLPPVENGQSPATGRVRRASWPPPMFLGNSVCNEVTHHSMFSPLYRIGSRFLLELGTYLQSLVYPEAESLGRGAPQYSRPKANNPIEPCGACLEWLKKITEVQPQFRIVNFTDESCDEIFVKRVR